jgi:hypothetical protein
MNQTSHGSIVSCRLKRLSTFVMDHMSYDVSQNVEEDCCISQKDTCMSCYGSAFSSVFLPEVCKKFYVYTVSKLENGNVLKIYLFLMTGLKGLSQYKNNLLISVINEH